MQAEVGHRCAETGTSNRLRPAWQTILRKLSPASRWSWLLTIVVALIYAASFAIFIHHHTSLPFFDGQGYVMKTWDLAEKLYNASFLERLNPELYFGGFRPERPPLLIAVAAIVLGPNPGIAEIAYVWLTVRVTIVLLSLYLLSREFGTTRFVPAAALVIFASPLMCNFYRLYFMDEPFAAFGLLAFTLILIDDRRQTMGSAFAASAGILALFLVKPVAPAFVFPFCVIRAARVLMGVRQDWPNLKRQAPRLILWAAPYVVLVIAMAVLFYATPYGPAIREQFELGSAGYWEKDITGVRVVQLVSVVLPPWLLLALVGVLPFSRGFRHQAVLLYSLGGLVWWLLFSFFLTYAVEERLLGQAMPYIVTAILIWACQRPAVALGVTLAAGFFFTYNLRVVNGDTKPRSALVRFLSPVPLYQQPVPEVGLLRFASRLDAAVEGHESNAVYAVFGDAYVDPNALNIALRMAQRPPIVNVHRVPPHANDFDIARLCQTRWFITKTRRQHGTTYANTGLWTSVDCVHALITDATSPLHPYFRKVLEHPIHQPNLDDTLVLWQVASSPPEAAIAESLRWLQPRLTNHPPAFSAAIESQLKARSN